MDKEGCTYSVVDDGIEIDGRGSEKAKKVRNADLAPTGHRYFHS